MVLVRQAHTMTEKLFSDFCKSLREAKKTDNYIGASGNREACNIARVPMDGAEAKGSLGACESLCYESSIWFWDYVCADRGT
jgi:hypothetical protein